MIWLTLRQFRNQAAAAVGALIILGVLVAITGTQLSHLYDTSGIAACAVHGDCPTVDAAFLAHDNFLRTLLGDILLVVPGLIGAFWGAPLVARELETGTYRLAWTQSVTRTRWLVTKLVVIAVASMVVAGLVSLMVTLWFSPVDSVSLDRFTPQTFDDRGIVAIGYAAFAFVLGVALGLLIRRTLAAMALTLVAFAGARLAVSFWVRPQLMAPDHLSMPLTAAQRFGFAIEPAGVTFVASGTPSIPNAWVLSSRVIDATGRAPTAQSLHQFVEAKCPIIAAPPPPVSSGVSPGGHAAIGNQAAFQACIARLSTAFHEAVTYQPADRYWAFQWYETAIFVGLALVLAGFCLWWIRRRLG